MFDAIIETSFQLQSMMMTFFISLEQFQNSIQLNFCKTVDNLILQIGNLNSTFGRLVRSLFYHLKVNDIPHFSN